MVVVVSIVWIERFIDLASLKSPFHDSWSFFVTKFLINTGLYRLNEFFSFFQFLMKFQDLALFPIDSELISLRKLRRAGHLARMPMTRLPRQFLTSWVNHPRPHGRPQYTYGHSLTKSLKHAGIASVFKEWSQLAQDRSNWRKLFYSKAEFPPTRQNWSSCSHLCMYFSHFRTSESIDVQSSAMQTHLHSKLLMIWILFGRIPYYYYYLGWAAWKILSVFAFMNSLLSEILSDSEWVVNDTETYWLKIDDDDSINFCDLWVDGFAFDINARKFPMIVLALALSSSQELAWLLEFPLVEYLIEANMFDFGRKTTCLKCMELKSTLKHLQFSLNSISMPTAISTGTPALSFHHPWWLTLG